MTNKLVTAILKTNLYQNEQLKNIGLLVLLMLIYPPAYDNILGNSSEGLETAVEPRSQNQVDLPSVNMHRYTFRDSQHLSNYYGALDNLLQSDGFAPCFYL